MLQKLAESLNLLVFQNFIFDFKNYVLTNLSISVKINEFFFLN